MSELEVDGRGVPLPEWAVGASLAQVLRAAGSTAVKIACGEGVCGACTVLLDGEPVPSCLVPAVRAVGVPVQTGEGLAATPPGQALAGQLAARGALQCGYCVPGVLSGVIGLVGASAVPTTSEIRDALAGHVCRCTGYAGLVDAVARACLGMPPGPPRVDGPAKVSGEARFTADLWAPGTLSSELLTCRGVHAEVTVSPGTAMEVPGAIAVLGPDDVPAHVFSCNPHVDDPGLAPAETAALNCEARFAGDIVGLVIADNPVAAAAMAARVVQIERPLPAVVSVAEATAEGAPPVRRHDPGNVAFVCSRGGDRDVVDAALASAEHVVTGRYRFDPGPVGAMELPAAIASWQGDHCRIVSTSQTPQVIPDRLGRLLGVPTGNIDLEAVYIGGGFGLKEEMFLEPLAALASRHCGGRPVLVATTRAQISRLRRRHGFDIEIRTGVDGAGAPVARRMEITVDAGAEVGHSALICEHVCTLAAELYPMQHFRADGRVVLTNTTPSGAFRGYGGAELQFAVESHLDDLARRAGCDPLDYRRRLLLRRGDPDPVHGWEVRSFAAGACLDELVAHGWAEEVVQPPGGRWRRGRGVASLAIVTAAASAGHPDRASSVCLVGPDGVVEVETGVVEMGTGNHSMFASVAAEVLGVDIAQVRVVRRSSATAPADEGTFASRSVYVSANAVAAAAHRLRATIAARVAELTGGAPGPLTLVPEGAIAGGTLIGWASVGPQSAEGSAVVADNGLVAGAQMADVVVDTVTGEVRVERVVSVHDVGRVIDRDMAQGQVVGGVLQGIGITLSEQCRHDRGMPVDDHLLHQLLPTSASAPAITAVFVDDGSTGGLLRAKGLGEAPIVGIPAAIANAVAAAVGVRLTRAPFPPEAVAAAIAEAQDPSTSAARATATVSPRCDRASSTDRSTSPAR